MSRAYYTGWAEEAEKRKNRVPCVTMQGTRVHIVASRPLGALVTRCGSRIEPRDARAALIGGRMSQGGSPCKRCHGQPLSTLEQK